VYDAVQCNLWCNEAMGAVGVGIARSTAGRVCMYSRWSVGVGGGP